MRWRNKSHSVYGWIELAGLSLLLAIVLTGPAFAGEILFIVDDDAGVVGVPDKGSVDPGSDTNVGPGAHPALGLLQRMQALGHNVTVRDDGPSSAADLLGKDLLVISSSVGSGDITFAKFGATTLPIINMEPAAWDNLEMTSLDADGVAGTTITITNPGHPLAAGLSGVVSIAPTDATMNRTRAGNLFGPGVTLIATGPGADAGVTLFEYAPGSLLENGLPAPGRRIGFFWNATGTTFDSATAGRLFDAAVTYAVIPEPSSLCLAGMALFGVVAFKVRRCRRAAN
jgi:hypothetical protein